MTELLIVADDFTGALDTGIQFAKRGVSTRVTAGTSQAVPGPETVWVVDAETRHLPPQAAAAAVSALVKTALDRGIRRFYKKTDSALRGNIGAELEAMLLASGAGALYFAPAFPKAGRVTKNGVHFVDGVPAAESVFGRDPFEPVRVSDVSELIALQSRVPVRRAGSAAGMSPEVVLFDAETEQDLRAAAETAAREGASVLAGCAGFAEFLPSVFGLTASAPEEPVLPAGLVVVSGSVNPVTAKQIENAVQRGVPCFFLTERQKAEETYADTGDFLKFFAEVSEKFSQNGEVILASGTGVGDSSSRKQVADHIGNLVRGLLEHGLRGVYAVIGGDTLLAVMEKTGCREIVPLNEIAPGIVLSRSSRGGEPLYLISKSGGLGDENALLKMENYVREKRQR